MKMADLRQAVEGTGLAVVTTLQVAGNVVVELPDEPPEAVADRVHHAVLERFGFDLAVIVRTHDQLADAHHRDPHRRSHEGRLAHTIFLDAVPDPERVAALDPDRSPGDTFVVDGAEVFVRYGTGVAGSKLLLPWFERGLGVVGTARNANTVAKLVDLTA
jgi:uncharacterized protein (DUF1697 family)